MNHFDTNRQNKVVWTQADSTCTDATEATLTDNSNIIPFPARPAARKQPVSGKTGGGRSWLSLHQVLRITRERVLNHIRKIRKPAHGKCYGKYSQSVNAARRATG